MFVCFGLSVFEYQIRTKFSRSWNCLWRWIRKRILIPLPIQRIVWFMLWWVVEDLFTLIQKLIIYFNDWCTIILSDRWNLFQFSFNQYLGPCHLLGFVLDNSMHIVWVQDLEYALLQPTCCLEEEQMLGKDSLFIKTGLFLRRDIHQWNNETAHIIEQMREGRLKDKNMSSVDPALHGRRGFSQTLALSLH